MIIFSTHFSFSEFFINEIKFFAANFACASATCAVEGNGLFFDRDVSRLNYIKRETEKEYKLLDEVDDVW